MAMYWGNMEQGLNYKLNGQYNTWSGTFTHLLCNFSLITVKYSLTKQQA